MAAALPSTRMATLLASRSLRTQASIARSFAPRAVASASFSSSALARRPAQSAMTEAENLRLLNQQRKFRPISPHLTIYRYPLNMYMSISNRITGAALSAGLYVGAIAYLGLPLFGVEASSFVPSIVSFVGGLPVGAKVLAKTLVAAPFVYHSVNGVRHLMWDQVKLLSPGKMNTSGIATLAVSAVATIGLVGLGTFW